MKAATFSFEPKDGNSLHKTENPPFSVPVAIERMQKRNLYFERGIRHLSELYILKHLLLTKGPKTVYQSISQLQTELALEFAVVYPDFLYQMA